jgi:hypothetical protein
MTNDFIQIETTTDEATLRKLGEAAMSVAIQRGFVKIAQGVFLYDNKTLVAHQKKTV